MSSNYIIIRQVKNERGKRKSNNDANSGTCTGHRSAVESKPRRSEQGRKTACSRQGRRVREGSAAGSCL
jgi:hypothetical protein